MKKFILPLILGLIIGLGAGYLVFKKNCPEISFTDEKSLTSEVREKIRNLYLGDNFGLTGDTISHPISDSLARNLIAQYRTRNRKALFPLKTKGGDYLNGYYIDRGPLDTILKDKTFNGITFYIAKDSTANVQGITSRTFTLVYMGAKKINGTTYTNVDVNGNTSTAYDFIKPCPPYCGDFLEIAAKDKKIKR